MLKMQAIVDAILILPYNRKRAQARWPIDRPHGASLTGLILGGKMELTESVLNLILQAERKYQEAIGQSVMKAEEYVKENKAKQDAYMLGKKQDWDLFEVSENDKFERMLVNEEHRMEVELAEKKEHLRLCQQEKADLISERLKKEVLSLHGSS